MENLSKIRKIAGISPKVMSKLLNVTVHTYNAFEKGNMMPSPEIIRMIAMMYRVDESVLTNDSLPLDHDTVKRLLFVAELSENDRFIYLYSEILKENETPNYHSISLAKERIRNSLINKK